MIYESTIVLPTGFIIDTIDSRVTKPVMKHTPKNFLTWHLNPVAKKSTQYSAVDLKCGKILQD